MPEGEHSPVAAREAVTGMRLSSAFFARPSPVVARELLGKRLVRRLDGETRAWTITETEAYEGSEDLASHASKGRTARTEVMFGPPGVFYVYLIYGLHHMLNVVTHSEGFPSAVLLRGVETLPGPGKLTRALGIDKALNTRPAAEESGLWFSDPGLLVADEDVLVTPRIGVDYAGPLWAAMPWRFLLAPERGKAKRKAGN